MNARELAERFHEAYERLAPQFGYTTRLGTRVFDPESDNGRLMIAVVEEVCGPALRLLAAAEANDGSTPVAWVRMRDGKIDWAEDCLGSSEDDIHAEEYDDEDGITAAPLYSQDSINGLAARVGELEAERDALKRHAEAMADELENIEYGEGCKTKADKAYRADYPEK